jgi:hypothetical protein
LVDIKVELKGYDKLRSDLDRFAKRAFPYAVRDTLTGSAFALQKSWREDVRRSFTLRNRFTEQAIRVDKARGTDVSAMQATTGTVAPYMRDQEEGNEVKGKGKHKAIPTAIAAGQGQGAKRTRMVRTGLRLQAVNIPPRTVPIRGKRRQNAVLMAIAIRKGERFALLNRIKGKGRAVFEVKGGKRSGRARMVWDMSKGSVKVPREPTLERSINASQRGFEQAQYRAVIKQLQRNKVLGY